MFKFRLLEQKWRIIRLEAFSIFGQKQTGFHGFAVHLVVSGMWQAFFLYMQGKQITENCIRAPVTCKLLQKMKEISGNVRGEVRRSETSLKVVNAAMFLKKLFILKYKGRDQERIRHGNLKTVFCYKFLKLSF